MTLEQLCNEVLELDEKATKGPWKKDIPCPIEYRLPQFDERRLWLPNPEVDLPLVFNYRTSAPKLARMCQIMVQALEYCAIDPGLLHPENNAQHATAMYALAEIEKIVGE